MYSKLWSKINRTRYNQQTQTLETSMIVYTSEVICDLTKELQTLDKIRYVFNVTYHGFNFVHVITELQFAFICHVFFLLKIF